VAGRARLRAAWPAPLAALALPWLLLPPVVLLTVSVAHPIYTYRYIAFCIPAIALLAGTALAALDLVTRLGGEVHALAFLIELIALKGRARLGAANVYTVLKY